MRFILSLTALSMMRCGMRAIPFYWSCALPHIDRQYDSSQNLQRYDAWHTPVILLCAKFPWVYIPVPDLTGCHEALLPTCAGTVACAAAVFGVVRQRGPNRIRVEWQWFTAVKKIPMGVHSRPWPNGLSRSASSNNFTCFFFPEKPRISIFKSLASIIATS